MTYLIRYAIAESNFMKLLILRHSVAYGIPNLNSLQFNLCGFLQGKKVCTRPVPLYLPVQLPDVVCHRQQGYLCLHILIPTAQETPEPCVLLQVPKSPSTWMLRFIRSSQPSSLVTRSRSAFRYASNYLDTYMLLFLSSSGFLLLFPFMHSFLYGHPLHSPQL
jgi:hypothetical protein